MNKESSNKHLKEGASLETKKSENLGKTGVVLESGPL